MTYRPITDKVETEFSDILTAALTRDIPLRDSRIMIRESKEKEPALFDLEPLPVPVTVKMSAGARLTARNYNMLGAGRHPAAGGPTRPDLGTCGNCDALHRYRVGNKLTVFKCANHRLGESHSSASDIRLSWPACQHWTPKDER